MMVECPKCRTEQEYDNICHNCKNKISFFPRIVDFGARESHLVITITSFTGIILGAIFGYFVSREGPPSSAFFYSFFTIAVCANVGILPGYAVGKNTLFFFNATRTYGPSLQYGSILLTGGIHGLIYMIILTKASGWEISDLSLVSGIIGGALLLLSSVLYIRKNVKLMNNWW
ncbi:hypothetical protein HY745_02320 [Candidatus Desantisbacteria bacterium]|nr:hypothetical protein [Candidatus Desantisbacteria bacterium]